MTLHRYAQYPKHWPEEWREPAGFSGDTSETWNTDLTGAAAILDAAAAMRKAGCNCNSCGRRLVNRAGHHVVPSTPRDEYTDRRLCRSCASPLWPTATPNQSALEHPPYCGCSPCNAERSRRALVLSIFEPGSIAERRAGADSNHTRGPAQYVESLKRTPDLPPIMYDFDPGVLSRAADAGMGARLKSWTDGSAPCPPQS